MYKNIICFLFAIYTCRLNLIKKMKMNIKKYLINKKIIEITKCPKCKNYGKCTKEMRLKCCIEYEKLKRGTSYE